ncbi:MAG: putative metal-binding motif-containing protein [Alphaproteobacteria bacterium]|nr:putative metal-binding motif-containing protein [Alphaproteobacteria bacterium]
MVAFARDLDGDGYGDPDASDLLCAADATHVVDASDCDDSDPDVNPAGVEVCNGADDDCDGLVDEDGSPTTWYRDADADGFGDASLTQIACAAPAGFVVDGTDCDDTAAGVNPGAAEVCDGADQDCDGLADQGLPTFTFYADGDGDGYGTGTASMDCVQPVGTALVANDCDDADPDVSPGATETCNGVDDDCDRGDRRGHLGRDLVPRRRR